MDERTEQLINRRLDGEITEEESLELDKRLIRSPEARAYLEEQAWPAREDLWHRYLRPVAAVAAMIAVTALVASIPYGRSREPASTPLVADNDQGATRQAGQPVMTVPVDDNWSGLPRAGRHEVIGVYDDATQSLYLLEMSPRSGTNSPSVVDF